MRRLSTNEVIWRAAEKLRLCEISAHVYFVHLKAINKWLHVFSRDILLMISVQQIFKIPVAYSTFSVSVLTLPVKAITSISTEAPSGSFPAWKQVRTGKFDVKTKKTNNEIKRFA